MGRNKSNENQLTKIKNNDNRQQQKPHKKGNILKSKN